MGLPLSTKCMEKQREMPMCKEKLRKGKYRFLKGWWGEENTEREKGSNA